MQLTVTGKQVDVGGALRNHVEETLEALLGKYFRTAIEAHAVFTREAHLIAVELSLHVGRGMVVNSRGTATEYYLAFDTAKDANDYLVYVRKTGVLLYDVDGSGSKAAVAIATLKPGLKLTYADFQII